VKNQDSTISRTPALSIGFLPRAAVVPATPPSSAWFIEVG
jgi:hypothetical protein